MKKARLITSLLGLTFVSIPCMSMVGCSKTYTVTWLNEDKTVLEIDKNVKAGSIPRFDGNVPTKQEDGFGKYTFKGWNKELTEVHSDQIYVASYECCENPSVTSFKIDLKDSFKFSFKKIEEVKGKQYLINWGDGTIDNNSYHTYEEYGNYTIMLLNVSNVTSDDNDSITSIKFGDTINQIDKSAFRDCKKLETINIPNSVEIIANGAFDSCSSLKDVQLPNNLKVIGGNAFNECNSFKKLFIPASVESIGTYAFKGCDSLEEINVDPNNTYFNSGNNDNVLINTRTRSLIKGCNKSKIPTDVNELSQYCFENCNQLTSIDIPSTVTKISDCAFRNCHHLQSVTIPDSVTYFGYSIFYQCGNLQTIHIPNNLPEIPYQCFYRCFKLQNIEIPSTVTKIGSNAFCECTHMDSIYIPETVTKIDSVAFFGCTSLIIKCEPEERPSGWSENWCMDVKDILWNQSR